MLDDVGIGLELHVVEDAHRGHHEAQLAGELLAQRLDLLGQPVLAVLGAVDQRQQGVADLDLQVVQLQGCGGGSSAGSPLPPPGPAPLAATLSSTAAVLLPVNGREPGRRRPRGARRAAAACRAEGHHGHHGRRHAERLGIARKLLDQRLVGGAADAGFRHEQAGRGGDDQRRDLADETVADGQASYRRAPRRRSPCPAGRRR